MYSLKFTRVKLCLRGAHTKFTLQNENHKKNYFSSELSHLYSSEYLL